MTLSTFLVLLAPIAAAVGGFMRRIEVVVAATVLLAIASLLADADADSLN